MKRPDIIIEIAIIALAVLLLPSQFTQSNITGMATSEMAAPQNAGFTYESTIDIKQSIDYSLNDYEQLSAIAKEIASSCSGRDDVDSCISEFAEYGNFDEHGDIKINDHLSLRFGSCKDRTEEVFDRFVQLLKDCTGQDKCYCGSLKIKDLPEGYVIQLEQKDENTVARLLKDGTILKETSFANELIYFNENNEETNTLPKIELWNEMIHRDAEFVYDTTTGERVFIAGAGGSGLLFKGAGYRAAPTISKCTIKRDTYKLCGISSQKVLAYDSTEKKTSYKTLLYPFALKIT